MRNIRHYLLICLCTGVLASCQIISDTPPADNSQTPTSNIDKTKLLQLVNNLRQQGCTCGSTAMPAVPALVWNDLLENAAKGHSQDMHDKNYFAHNSQDGRTFSQRITAAGYAWASCGENIAKGYPTEEAVMTGWRNSEGHCKNIMGASFKEMGVGKVGDYWTQVFGSK